MDYSVVLYLSLDHFYPSEWSEIHLEMVKTCWEKKVIAVKCQKAKVT